MEQNLVIYHGSQQIVEVPRFGVGKNYNDYGQEFYCTENNELAKEWACPVKNDGYSNKYHLILEGLNVIHLTQEELAKESSVSLNTIRAYERKSKDINKAQIDIVLRLAKALKCDITELLD